MAVPVARERSFEVLLDYLRRSRGCDLGGYKRPGLKRRVARRMRSVGVAEFAGYAGYLADHPEEFPLLFDSILINVTSFFRDPPVWDALIAEIVPRLAGARGGSSPIRVWSAGCATGQEPWSLAVVLAEALGIGEYLDRVTIYASDLDETALRTARAGHYREAQLGGVPERWRKKYFVKTGAELSLREDLRRPIVFGRHDLMLDPPIPRLDLISCRNTLMYFEAPAQRTILARLHGALEPEGYLLLGEAEMPGALGGLFRPADPRHRIFAKIGMAARGRAEVGR